MSNMEVAEQVYIQATAILSGAKVMQASRNKSIAYDLMTGISHGIQVAKLCFGKLYKLP
jgi:hypothetical protein